MIRYFAGIYKRNRDFLSDIELFTREMVSFRPQKARCPACGATGNFSFLCRYQRDLITYSRGAVIVHEINIDRYICGSCEHSHAVLPEILIPFGSYSLFFVFEVLRAYFSRAFTGCTVEDIRAKYQISVSTIYAWKKRFLAQKALWLGVLENLTVPDTALLPDRVIPSGLLSDFFDRFGFSFLQDHRRASASGVP